MKTKTIIALAALTVGSANAAVLVTPTSIVYTTSTNQEAPGLNLDNETNLINGNGLSTTPTLANYTTVTHAAAVFSSPGNAWATIDPGAGGGDFYAQGGIAPTFGMTLDQSYGLTDFVYWDTISTHREQTKAASFSSSSQPMAARPTPTPPQ